MSVAAVIGAGALGGAVVQALAERAAFRQIRLIDAQMDVASGKALDIRQSGPIDRADVDITAGPDALDAAGADVIVIADPVDPGSLDGDAGLDVVRRLIRAGTTAPIVFAGPGHTTLIERVHRELRVAADRLVGSAAAAQAAGVRALTALELNLSGAEIHAAVAGRPPAFVIGWSSATVSGSLVSDRVPPHRLVAVSRAAAALWPPRPHAIGLATAQLAAALARGSRRQHQAMTIAQGELGLRDVATTLPLVLGHGRILARIEPSLSPDERTRARG